MKQPDLWLYVGVAVCAAFTASFQTDEALNYIPPETLFFLRAIIGAAGAGFLAAKMYRSTTYADNKASQTISPPIPAADNQVKTP